MPEPGCMMPTMRSPGTAPSGAKRTGRSPRDAADRHAHRPCLRCLRPCATRGPESGTACRRRCAGSNQPSSRGFGGVRDALFLVVGEDGLHHVRRRQLAAADGGQHVLDILAGQPRQHRLQAVLGEGLAGPLEGALEDACAQARNIACGWRSWSRGGSRRAPCR